jgi:hypothetical protein
VKLVPVEIDGKDICGFMAGKARIVGDIETSAPKNVVTQPQFPKVPVPSDD